MRSIFFFIFFVRILSDVKLTFPQEKLTADMKDRSADIAISLQGTYIKKSELIIYPFFEYLLDQNREYQPD